VNAGAVAQPLANRARSRQIGESAPMRTFHDPEVFSRVRRLPPPLGGAMDRLRDEVAARGVDVVDLSTGSPAGAPPAAVIERLKAAADDPRLHRRGDPRGLPELRQAASRWWKRRRSVELDAEREILVTAGAEEGIALALSTLLAEGDAILAPTPSDPVHAAAAVLAGAEPIPVPVGPGVDFFNSLVEATERAEKRPKGIVVNFPATPSGAVATPELLEKIVRFAEARDLFVVSDLVQHDVVYDGRRAPAVLDVPGARERAVELTAVSTCHGMGGWAVGFCAGNAAIVAAMGRVQAHLGAAPFGIAQAGAVAALDGCDDEVEQARRTYERRRDALVARFREAGWAVAAPAATPFAWAALPAPFRAMGSAEFARRLLDAAGVCVAPGAAFGRAGDGFVRITLAEDEPRLRLAAERVRSFLEQGPGGK
jgi:alanine-synthesizing transaminase